MSAEEARPHGQATERWLVEAGIGPGMRVLDVGCGNGDVALMAAERVGPEGEVVGVDHDVAMLERARRRSEATPWVRFVHGDFLALGTDHGVFDAVVGRRVLMYQPDPVEAVRNLAAVVHPGGLLLFQEMDAAAPALPGVDLPLHEQVRGWIWRTLERMGAHVHMGSRLPSVFTAAGLQPPEVRAEAIVHTPHTDHPMAQVVQALLPRIVALRVARPEDVGIDTLQARLKQERVATGGLFVGEMVFGAWARTQG